MKMLRQRLLLWVLCPVVLILCAEEPEWRVRRGLKIVSPRNGARYWIPADGNRQSWTFMINHRVMDMCFRVSCTLNEQTFPDSEVCGSGSNGLYILEDLWYSAIREGGNVLSCLLDFQNSTRTIPPAHVWKFTDQSRFDVFAMETSIEVRANESTEAFLPRFRVEREQLLLYPPPVHSHRLWFVSLNVSEHGPKQEMYRAYVINVPEHLSRWNAVEENLLQVSKIDPVRWLAVPLDNERITQHHPPLETIEDRKTTSLWLSFTEAWRHFSEDGNFEEDDWAFFLEDDAEWHHSIKDDPGAILRSIEAGLAVASDDGFAYLGIATESTGWLARKFEEELSWIRIKGKDSLHVDVKLREWIRQQEAGAGFYGMPVIGANLSDGPGNIFHGILVQNRRDFTSVRREERAENATEQ
ncbi:hypothetical protein GUITHDRAFT_101965 [Guillardia theta CCMP2712]|uniref:Uncharacterized protein n=1 Tax=Guillardia theta (strain CCMP2712) TaxID=905079 RepID=L1JV24_GUITC|nr:hypothetical protein GUITHDRAFT_101965 [Guillardia theta CCMP2712]EKX52060.1 hypothetical protein GUITHDRAFT_101965 [Guillardia theta CCMP2712]|eukprot:XP_005839040.1 hypothetical protein GUITHDRAFT_101965 [Guillardia theta CCMP2712]